MTPDQELELIRELLAENDRRQELAQTADAQAWALKRIREVLDEDRSTCASGAHDAHRMSLDDITAARVSGSGQTGSAGHTRSPR